MMAEHTISIQTYMSAIILGNRNIQKWINIYIYIYQHYFIYRIFNEITKKKVSILIVPCMRMNNSSFMLRKEKAFKYPYNFFFVKIYVYYILLIYMRATYMYK